MVLVEMSFSGAGGLEELVGSLAEAVEAALERQDLAWKDDYPVTLRESLRLGLQQQIVGGHACHCGEGVGKASAYRVWVGLPEGGLRAWTEMLLQRLLEGCGKGHAAAGSRVRRDLQGVLVQVLGPCLQRAEAASLLPGLAAV